MVMITLFTTVVTLDNHSGCPLSEEVNEERLHGLPRPPVSLSVVRNTLGLVVAGGGVREAVNGPAVNHLLPIDAPGPHLVLKGVHILARYVGIVAAVQDQNLAFDVLCVGWGRSVQAAVKAHHARNVGAAAG